MTKTSDVPVQQDRTPARPAKPAAWGGLGSLRDEMERLFDAFEPRLWLDRAAEQGHPRALYNLGAALASGAKGEPDMKGAAVYYERAAKAGNIVIIGAVGPSPEKMRAKRPRQSASMSSGSWTAPTASPAAFWRHCCCG